MFRTVQLVVSYLMVVGKLSILVFASPTLANTIDNPRFFEYRNGGLANRIIDQTFGWFKTLDNEQKLSYNQALMHAVSYADNGQPVRWYKNDAGGSVTPSLTWPSGNGFCRRIYIQTTAYGVEKNMKTTACYDDNNDRWTWHTDK